MPYGRRVVTNLYTERSSNWFLYCGIVTTTKYHHQQQISQSKYLSLMYRIKSCKQKSVATIAAKISEVPIAVATRSQLCSIVQTSSTLVPPKYMRTALYLRSIRLNNKLCLGLKLGYVPCSRV